MMPLSVAEDAPATAVERWFDATPDRLFAAYQDPALLIRWFGPPQVSRWLSFEHDLSEGAALTYGFVTDEGEEIWGRCDFTVVEPCASIAFISSVTNDRGEAIPPVAGRDWMLRVFTSVTITPLLGGALLRVAAAAYGAGALERAFFGHMWPRLQARFTTSLDILDVLLREPHAH